jgi:hypothetical protein
VYFGYPQAHEDDAERAVPAGPHNVSMTIFRLRMPGRLNVVTPLHHLRRTATPFARSERGIGSEALALTQRIAVSDPVADAQAQEAGGP